MKLNFFNQNWGRVLAIAALAIMGSNAARAESFGINFLGDNADSVTGSAGVVPISGWNNIANTTTASGTIMSSDGSISAGWTLDGGSSAGGWHSGTAADGGDSSLLDGYMDVVSGSSANFTVSGLTGSSYSVYVYTEGDAQRPGNGGDFLPNYSVNNVTNFTATTSGAFTSFIESGSTSANNNTYPPGLTFGNYTVFYNVVPVGGVITISAGLSTQTWRSPMNGIEIVAAATVNPIQIIKQPTSQRVVTNSAATFSVAATGTPIVYQWYKIAGAVTNLIPNETNLSYTTPPVQDSDTGTGYYVVLSNSLGDVASSVAVLTAGHYVGPVTGFLESDQFPGFATGLDALTALYPGSTYPDNNSPAKTEYLTSLNDNQDLANNSGERIYGWFTPTVTANYIFYVASDDQAALWLSTDNTPDNVYQIAQVQAWMYAQDWTLTQTSSAEATGGFGPSGEWRSDQFEMNGGPSAISGAIFGFWSPWPGLNGDGSITLTAGTPYYMELDHWQGAGGQCAAVTYKIAGQTDPVYQSVPLLAGGVLSTMKALDGAAIVITNQPANVSVEQNSSASFKVVAGTYVEGAPTAAAPALEYQWQVKPVGAAGFTNIPGAFSATYSTPLTAISDDGNQYRVQLTTLNSQINSSAVTLSVQPDVIPPVVSNIGATSQRISVTWNKLLDPASALDLANYAVDGGVTITSATLTNMVAGAYAAATVQLAFTGAVPGQNYHLTVNNVKDLSQLQTVAANTQVPFTAYNVFLDFNEGSASFAPAVTNVNGLATLGLNSGVHSGGGLALTIPSGGNGGFVINDPVGGAAINNFIVAFKLFVGPFPNNNNNNPDGYGNGLSLSFGPSSEVYWGGAATNAGDVTGSIAGPDVLAIGFNTTSDGASINVYYGGVAITNATVASDALLVNGEWVDMTVQLNSDGTVDVAHNGSLYVNHLALPGYVLVSAGNFLFNGSSGLAWNQSILDNLAILENASLPPALLGLTASGTNATLTWTPAPGRLQTTSALGGGWTDVPASQPVVLPVSGTNAFFRVVVP